MEELRRIFEEKLDIYFLKETSHFDHERFQDTEEKSKTNQHLAGLQQKARQSRLATEADAESDTKTRKRTEDAAADRRMNGDSSSASVVEGPTSLTSFGIIVNFRLLKNALVTPWSTKALKRQNRILYPWRYACYHPPPVAYCSLLFADTVSTAMRAIFHRPLFSWSLGQETKERTDWTNFNQLAPSFWRKSYKLNQGKLWCLILANVQVTCAAARFRKGCARCFVGRFVWAPDSI